MDTQGRFTRIGRAVNLRKGPKVFRVHINNDIIEEVKLEPQHKLKDVLPLLENKQDIILDPSIFTLQAPNKRMLNLDGQVGSLKATELFLEPPYSFTEASKKKLFGEDLSRAVAKRKTTSGVPYVLEQCLAFLDQEEILEELGLFRLSGSKKAIERYRRLFDSGMDVHFPPSTDPHVVTGLVKLYLKTLPEPLCTERLYDVFIEAGTADGEPERISRVTEAVKQLPVVNYQVLRYLAAFCYRLVRHAAVNKMPASNVAIVIGPNVFFHSDLSVMASHTSAVCAAMSVIIEHFPDIFPEHHLDINSFDISADHHDDDHPGHESNRDDDPTLPDSLLSLAQEEEDDDGDNDNDDDDERLINYDDKIDDINDNNDNNNNNGDDDIGWSSTGIEPPHDNSQDNDDHEHDDHEQEASYFLSEWKESALGWKRRAEELQEERRMADRRHREELFKWQLQLEEERSRREEITDAWRDAKDKLHALQTETAQTIEHLNSEILSLRHELDQERRRSSETETKTKQVNNSDEHQGKNNNADSKNNNNNANNNNNNANEDDNNTDNNNNNNHTQSDSTDQCEYQLPGSSTSITEDISSEDKDKREDHTNNTTQEIDPEETSDSSNNGDTNLLKADNKSDRETATEKQEGIHGHGDHPIDDAKHTNNNNNTNNGNDNAIQIQDKEKDTIKTCTACQDSISGEWLMANGKEYHKNCFRCNQCNQQIRGPFAERKDGLWCRSCIDEVRAASGSSSRVLVRQRKNSRRNSQQQQQRCAACQEEINSGERIVAIGRSYHSQCFVCQRCSNPFQNMKFFDLDGVPVCRKCKRKHNKEKKQKPVQSK